MEACVSFGLRGRVRKKATSEQARLSLTNTFASRCRYFRPSFVKIIWACALSSPFYAQFNPRSIPLPSSSAKRVEPNARIVVKRENAPGPDEVRVQYINLNAKAPVYELRGAAEVETTESLLKADEIDYNEETGYAEARGNVYLKNLDTGEEMWCDRAEYDVNNQTGKFYNVKGLTPVKLDARPGVLTSPNPFVFQGKWAERIKDRYILHSGFITSCKLPKPLWRLTGPKFDIMPGQRAIAQRAFFKVGGVPIFYMPYFYKSLAKQPRKRASPRSSNSLKARTWCSSPPAWAAAPAPARLPSSPAQRASAAFSRSQL